MKPVIMIHYGELALKGENRSFFEQKLLTNMRYALHDFDVHIQQLYGRTIIEGALLQDGTECKKIMDILQHIFGISVFFLAYTFQGDYEDIEQNVLELAQKHIQADTTFAVRTRRVNKQFPISSEEVNRRCGAAIVEKCRARVDLTHPELTVQIIITTDGHFISTERYSGVGGLPIGTSGTVLSLISSGIDSPVASFRMMKRGAKVLFLHFHSYPFTSRASMENVEIIVRHLQQYQPKTVLFFAPLVELQKKIVTDAPERFRILLFRRAMFQIGEMIARTHGAGALITGESLSQVASQTIENITVTNTGLTMPIFRPLIGHDKQEIMNEAQRLGTYEYSIRPYEDCCSLLMPRSVATRARVDDVLAAERKLPWKELLAEVVSRIEQKNV